MTKEELAAKLDGSEYPFRPDGGLMAMAAAAGLVVVYGASDDLMEFDGAIKDEVSCYDGGRAYLKDGDLLRNDCDNDNCPNFKRDKEAAQFIDALWCEEGDYSWTYKTDIPHATFEIVDSGDQYCRGIVFHIVHIQEGK